MTEREADAVAEMRGTCEDPVGVVTETGEAVLEPTPERHQGPVSGDCREADDAGETLVQGSRVGGDGFPAEMAPSARDGVVYEE